MEGRLRVMNGGLPLGGWLPTRPQQELHKNAGQGLGEDLSPLVASLLEGEVPSGSIIT